MKTLVDHAIRMATVMVLTASCGGGSVSDGNTGPVIPVDTIKPPGTVQRATLTIRITIDPADVSVANTAGVTAAGTSVRLTRTTAGFTPQSATVAANGTVQFENLLDGIYTVSADRALSSSEIAQLAPDDREVTLFAGGTDVAVSPPANATKDVSLVGNRRGSLVISELFPFNGILTPTGPLYGLGGYIEVYNNSDTTAYLDGMMLLGTHTGASRDYSPNFPCSGFPQSTRLDSTALYTPGAWVFPGTGQDFPILPGQAKVIAMDAMDHRPAGGVGQMDLSRADFEQIGSEADIDNPFAANLIRIYGSTGAYGRGYPYVSGALMYVLLSSEARQAVAPAAWMRMDPNGPGIPSEILRVPSQYRLDVLGVEYVPGQTSSTHCTPWTSPAYDHAPAPLVDNYTSIAISRKTLGRTTDGREILQRTRTSARDFEYHQPLLRSLRK